MNLSSKPLSGAPGGEPVPTATYRLQFHRDFTFGQAAAIVEYLRALGISHVYASPLFQAGPDSTHGYDICRFDQLNPLLGTQADFDRFSARLRQAGLGLILDMVPNHMGNDPSNAWWMDVLRHGPASPFAAFFDIDWHPLQAGFRDQVLLPILEDHYFKVLEAGKLRLTAENGQLTIAYHDRRFPLRPESYGEIANALREASGVSAPVTLRGDGTDAAVLLEKACHLYRGEPGQASSFDRLHHLLARQHYRLAYWRIGPEAINYRRFFDVTQLVGVRMERPDVFEATHRLVFALLQTGQLSGLRIDHPDGLWDPKGYLDRLQTTYRQVVSNEPNAPSHPLYLLVEKILSGNEPLPPDWPVAGTTGYDFLNVLNGLFVNSDNRDAFDQLYREFSGEKRPFRDLVHRSKQQILANALSSEWQALSQRLNQLASRTRRGQDFTPSALRAALGEIIAHFPVYRTYYRDGAKTLSPLEQQDIHQAVAATKAAPGSLDPDVVDFLQDLLLLRAPPDFDDAARQLHREFVCRFQQLTGPVTAKGVEDTAFYIYNRLVSLNEVGGDPDAFGVSPNAFHQFNQRIARDWPHTLLATATHDTKRGEDVRARLNVLSEMPAAWRLAIKRWREANADKKTSLDGVPAPSPNDEYLLYQVLIGAWPTTEEHGLDSNFHDRIHAYVTKALREAKAHTNWTNPNESYEKATQQFVRQILDPGRSQAFLEDFRAMQRQIAFFGLFNSLAQVLLKTTSPGVPDFYQGTELWDLSLVDPDNRRPVDFESRRLLLGQWQQASPKQLADALLDPANGALKMFVTARALSFRQCHASLFRDGEYLPLTTTGQNAAHAVALARVAGDQSAIVIVPRLVWTLLKGKSLPPLGLQVWGDTAVMVPPGLEGRYHNVFTGEEVAMAATPSSAGQISVGGALQTFPVALLRKTASDSNSCR